MKFASRPLVLLLVFSLCLPLFRAGSAQAESIAWDGTQGVPPGTPPGTDPFGFSALIPSAPNYSNNTVTVTGNVLGSVYGGTVDGNAPGISSGNNNVSISNSAVIQDDVSGGLARNLGVGNDSYANGSSVSLSGSSASSVYGGRARSESNSNSGTATANNNTVSISGNSSVQFAVIGGEAWSFSSGIVSSTATAGYNNVSVSDSNVGEVIGGSASSNENNGPGSGTVTATYNIVTLSGMTSITLNLQGGSGTGAPGSDVFTGNTLNVKTGGISVGGNLGNFQFLNFYVPQTMGAGGVMLTVAGTADLTDGAGRSSTVNVGIEGGSSPLQAGDKIVLIDAGTLTGAPANTTANGQGMQGVTLLYNFDVLAQGNQLLAQVTSAGLNPQTKSFSEGRVAGLGFLNQGSDLIIGPGMYSILASTQGLTQGGFVPFAAGSGGFSRYNTGSHVDVSGASMMTGLAWRQLINEGKSGSVLAGAFFEAGWGGYDSHNSFSNAVSVKGDGDISYCGGGLLGRYDFAPFTTGAPGNIYLDASFRAGHMSTDFSSSDLIDNAGRKANYDSGAAYYGAHAGLGYLWNITEKASLDLSTRYIWTHQDSDSVKVLGDPVKFNAVDSRRWRSGVRFAYVVNDSIAPYAGAYYDHEFDGKARASTNGYSMDTPSLKGDTGVGELGLTIKPVKDNGFSMDLGVQGYTGVREGVSGSLQLKLEF